MAMVGFAAITVYMIFAAGMCLLVSFPPLNQGLLCFCLVEKEPRSRKSLY